MSGGYNGRDDATLDVLELPGGRIKFQLVALAVSSAPGGPNTGVAFGVIAMHQGKAIYKSGNGNLILRFLGGKVAVSQQGRLPGFGMGVNASGVYVKKSKKPSFNATLDQPISADN